MVECIHWFENLKTVWKSESEIEGYLDENISLVPNSNSIKQKSFLNMDLDNVASIGSTLYDKTTFQEIKPIESPMNKWISPFQTQREQKKYPLAFINVRKCRRCNEIRLTAFELYFTSKDKIIEEMISERKIGDGSNTEGKLENEMIEYILPDFPVRQGRKSSNIPNMTEYSKETQEAMEELIQEIFSVEGFLSESQAKVIAKIKLGRKLRSSTERNIKRQLKKKIEKAEYIKDFWEDLEDLI